MRAYWCGFNAAAGAGTKMDEPLGWTHTDLDARFDTVRRAESNIGARWQLDALRFLVPGWAQALLDMSSAMRPHSSVQPCAHSGASAVALHPSRLHG